MFVCLQKTPSLCGLKSKFQEGKGQVNFVHNEYPVAYPQCLVQKDIQDYSMNEWQLSTLKNLLFSWWEVDNVMDYYRLCGKHYYHPSFTREKTNDQSFTSLVVFNF